MQRLIPSLAVLALALPSLAQTPAAKPTLQYKVAVGGLNAGTFSVIDLPTHEVALNGNDVVVIAKTTEAGERPIVLTSGSVSGMVQKILKDKVGQQMTVEIEIVAVPAASGQRCKLELDHAFLKAYTEVSMTFRPSELPRPVCKT